MYTPDDDSMISQNLSGIEWKWHLNKTVCVLCIKNYPQPFIKKKIKLKRIQRFSSYRAVNSLRLGYKASQLILYAEYRPLLGEPY
jgi:hypothetical protein